MITLPEVWHRGISVKTCSPGLTTLWLGEVGNLTNIFYLVSSAHQICPYATSWKRTLIIANQPTSQPANQLANQPANQPTNQLADQPANQLANQPSNQPANQLANQPAN